MKRKLLGTILAISASVNMAHATGSVLLNNYQFNYNSSSSSFEGSPVLYGANSGGTLGALVTSASDFNLGLAYAIGTVSGSAATGENGPWSALDAGFTESGAVATIGFSYPGYATGPKITIPGYTGGNITFEFLAFNGTSYATSTIRGHSEAVTFSSIATGLEPATQLTGFSANGFYVGNSDVSPVIVTQPTNQTVTVGDTASFSVSATGGQLSYQWSLNNTNILGANECTLIITNVNPCDLGVYSVVVSNEIGTATSSNALLSIYPFITTPFTGAITYWGQGATLSVGAIGSGQLSYQWYFNGVPIDEATGATLNFTSIQFTNAGLYSVVVSSPYGSITNAAYQVVVNPANVSLGFYPGVTISGAQGYSYIIQSSTNLANTNNWTTLTNLTLTQPVQLIIDTTVDASSPFNSQHFYRVLPGQQ